MARPSGKAQRIAALAELCRSGAIVHIADAARHTGASQITIRRDLDEGAEGLVCLGGYVMLALEGAEGYSLSAAQDREAEARTSMFRRYCRWIGETARSEQSDMSSASPVLGLSAGMSGSGI